MYTRTRNHAADEYVCTYTRQSARRTNHWTRRSLRMGCAATATATARTPIVRSNSIWAIAENGKTKTNGTDDRKQNRKIRKVNGTHDGTVERRTPMTMASRDETDSSKMKTGEKKSTNKNENGRN